MKAVLVSCTISFNLLEFQPDQPSFTFDYFCKFRDSHSSMKIGILLENMRNVSRVGNEM